MPDNPTNYIATSTELAATADAIREKTGYNTPIEWEEGSGFANAIADIPSGGGSVITVIDSTDSHGGTIKTIEAVDISRDTVNANTLQVGYTAHNRFGEPITGTLVPPVVGEYDWLGKNAELVDDDVYEFETTLDNTQFAGWSPSSTAHTCIATKTAKTRAVTDMDDNEYFLVWECGGDFAYNSGTTNKARPLFSRSLLIQSLFKRPSSWAMIQGEGFNGNTCATVLSANFLRYYGSTTGSVTYTWATSYGFYFGAQAATFSPTTGNATITIKTPLFYARTSNTYMSVANAGLIDQANSTVYMNGKLFRIKRDGILRGGYGLLVDMINGNGWKDN